MLILECNIKIVETREICVGDSNSIADVIPADYVVNAMLAAIPCVQKQNIHMTFQASSSTEKLLRWDVPIQV